MINILDHGAVGDGVTMNTEAFENAVEEAWKKSEKVRISNLNIDTDLNIPNDDGIHLCSCKGVTI